MDESGVNISVDFVGGPYFQGNLYVAVRDGHIVTLGALGGTKLLAGEDIGAFVGSVFDLKEAVCEAGILIIKKSCGLWDKLEGFLPQFEDGTFKIFIEKAFQ